MPCVALAGVDIPVEARLRQIQTLLQQGNWDEAQQKRFDEVSKKRSEKEASLLRTIEVKPY